MSLARRRHAHCENPPQILAVMNEKLFESGTIMEDFRELDLPPVALALQPLRRRIYGLLLHEKPRTGSEPIVVTEWCMHGGDSLVRPALVEPVAIQGREYQQLYHIYIYIYRVGFYKIWPMGVRHSIKII